MKPLSPLGEKCVKSWKTFLPDYEIKRWDEKNFDIGSHWFTKEAYQKKKYAFVSDYVRLSVLKQHGGIYLDADTELVKSLDPFLADSVFCGFQDESYVSAGVLGTLPGNPWMDELMNMYDSELFRNSGRRHFTTPNTVWITQSLEEKGLILNNLKQRVDGVVVYPMHIFNPYKYDDPEVRLHEETVAVHHAALSWLPWYKKYRLMVKKYVLKKYFPGLLKPISNIYNALFHDSAAAKK